MGNWCQPMEQGGCPDVNMVSKRGFMEKQKAMAHRSFFFFCDIACYILHIRQTASEFSGGGSGLRDYSSLSVVGPVAKTVAVAVAESMAVVSTVVVRVSLGLSLPLAVVNSVAVAVGGVAIALGPVATVQQVGISSGIGLSLSLPLSVVKSMAVAVVAKTVASVEEVGVSLCLGFRLSSSDGRESE